MTDTATPAPRLTREQLAGLIRRRTKRIGRRDRTRGPARLSAAQERLWFFEQVETGGFTYNMPAAARLTGRLDGEVLVAALGAVLERHEVLCSVIHWDGAKPVQLVLPAPPFDLPVVDLRHLPPAVRERELRRRLSLQARRGFDLAGDLPVRGLLLQMAADEHVLSLTFHHIACDAWSVGVFLRDLAADYARRTGGLDAPLAPLELQYGDFATWQRSAEFEQGVAAHLPFWQEHLAGAPAALELPLDHPRPARQGFHGTFFARRLAAADIERALVFGREHRATLFNVLLATFRAVIARLCGVDDLVIGTAVAGRTRREIEDLVGLFINTLPLRLALGDDPAFVDLMVRERDVALAALSHQEVPFERIVNELGGGRDNSRAPILQVLLQVQNNPAGRLELPGITMRRLELENPQSKLDLVVSFEAEDDGHYRVIWRWATALFERATMERLADRFETALAAVLRQPELRVSQWPLLLPAEAEQLRSWNETAVDYGAAEETLVSLFEAQVERTPGAVAVVMSGTEHASLGPPSPSSALAVPHGEGLKSLATEDVPAGTKSFRLTSALGPPSPSSASSSLTPGAELGLGGPRADALSYQELDTRANQLAHRLRALGVGPEVKVGICAERSLEMVVGLYGILKAGGAYVPMDPSYPEDRIAFMIADAAVPVMVTQSHLALPAHGAMVVQLDDPTLGGEPTTRPVRSASAEHLAYMIYTSGSTGRPKGAMNAHRGIVNRLLWMQSEYRLDASDRVLQKTPFSFDVSVWELFWPLVVGAQLVVAKPEGHKDPAYLVETIERHSVTTLHFVPSMLQGFVAGTGPERCTSLRRVMASGEALPADLVARYYEKLSAPLHNLYGPTEAAVDVTYWPTAADDGAIPIGFPVANTRIHVLDARLHEAPVGVAGELLIGGIQVGRGYHGRPALTAERFIPDPFATEPGARLYRTGDLARWALTPSPSPASGRGGPEAEAATTNAIGADQRVRLSDQVAAPRGHLEYLGRIDFQVKIRGFRIELGEIEAALAAQDGVREVVVTVRAVGGSSALVAYLTTPFEALDPAALRAALAARLPEYMVPTHFLVLAEMPLNPSGKVDRKRLPEPEARARVSAPVAPRTALEARLVELWAARLGGGEVGVHDDFFALGGNSIGGALLVNQLQDELGEIVHVVTLFEAPTPALLADFLEREYPAAVAKLVGAVTRGAQIGAQSGAPSGAVAEGISELDVLAVQASLAPLAASPVAAKNGRALFVLGPPRSGTTLLRVMLAGHPRLFAPPELELLGFDTLAERRAAFPGPDAFRLEGLTRAVMELLGVDGAEASRTLDALEREGLTVHELYGRLESWQGGRVLVDKTPTYGWDPATLARAEESFADARYLHLVRHPYGTIRSFEEARIDQIFYRREHPYSRRQLAEILWVLAHRNVLSFLETVPAERRLTVHFEQLVREPERVLRTVTDFLGLDFEPAMALPYGDPAASRSRRMTDGVHAESRMLGDVKFHQHRQVDARAADEWRSHYGHDFLSELTWRLAARLGYDPETERIGTSWARLAGEAARPGEEDVLSFQEERLWFLDQLEPGTSLYNLGSALTLVGDLDVAALESALGDLVARQASLGTRFDTVGGRPRRRTAGDEPFPLPFVDLSALSAEQGAAEARCRAAELAHGGFDLARGPLFRVLLVRLAADRHLFAYTLHHSIADGWSLRILIEELAELYRARLSADEPRLAPLAVSYADYARWQRRWLAGAELERQLAFWRGELAGAPTVLELPADRSRPAARSVQGDTVPLREGRVLAAALTRLAAHGSGVTDFMAFAATVAMLLGRAAGVSQVLLGIAVANRGRREVERLVGFFVNTLVLRVDLGGDPTVLELLGRVRKATLGAYGHAELPFEKLVEELQPERSLSHAPLVQVLLSYQNAAPPQLDLPGLTLEPVGLGIETAKFDLTFQIGETPQGLGGWLEYASDLFDRTTARRLLDRFGRLLHAAAQEPARRLSQLDWLAPVERQQLLEWNDTATAVATATVHGLFEAQARRTPAAVAVVVDTLTPSPSPAGGRGEQEVEGAVASPSPGGGFEGGEGEGDRGGEGLTYAQLDARANQLAHRLRRSGVGTEVLVALVIERSLELSVALLGILKAGGAYLPIDPSWPAERIAYMLADAQVPVLLTLGRLRAGLPETTAEILELDAPAVLAGEPETAVVPAATDPRALAYVIYTSGSTGRPKGTLNTHRGIVNRLLWMAPALDLGAADRFLQKTPVSFDVSVWELFVPLILGARLVYAAPGRHGEPDYLVALIRRHEVTVAHFVPSMLQAFVAAQGLETCTSLRRVVASGEALPPDLVARWYARLDVPLWNLYGPTETAVEVSYHETSARRVGALVPIGRPLPNTHLVVLDAALRAVPPGVAGELALGGVQIGRGYRNRPALTAAVFIPDPFAAEPGARLYRTGDLARALPNGEIEYLGRIDHQVKIRGFRIELGEIEVALASHPAVQAAVVLAQKGPGGDVALVGYVTLGALTTLTPGPSPAGGRGGPEGEGEAALRAHLATRLPDYMVPTWFVTLDTFPLNPSGKVDRRALAALEIDVGSAGEFVNPRSASEAMVAEIFAEVLDVPQVSAHDDFFALGGHSLKAIQLVSRLRAAWGVELPLKALFETPTVAGLAARLGFEPGGITERAFPKLLGDGPFELSFAQGRLWFLDRLEPGGVQYNIPTGLRLRGPLDPAALAAALAAVVERHETLRTRFVEGVAGPEVWIAPVGSDLLEVVDLTGLPAPARLAEAARRAAEQARRPFDLTSGRLIRALLLVLGTEDHGLVVTQHHIASDGWSLGIAMGDLAALYRIHQEGRGAALPPLRLRYVEFARWQRDELAAHLEERLAFWREALAGAPPLLALPTDRPRPVRASGRGGRLPIRLPAATLTAARELAEAGGATLFMVLLAAWQALLGRHAGADDVVVGSPVAGRLRPELESLVGFFVNTLVLRARLADELPFADLVAQVKGTVLAAFAHQDLPFERLVEELAPDRGAGHPPLFQVAFALQNAPVAPHFAGIDAEPLDFAATTAKFDLLLTLRETARGLVGGLEFDADLFDRTTALRLLDRFTRFLTAGVTAPHRRLAELSGLSPVERQQILLEWNDTATAVAPATVHGLFEAQARRTPDAVAVVVDLTPSVPLSPPPSNPPPGEGEAGVALPGAVTTDAVGADPCVRPSREGTDVVGAAPRGRPCSLTYQELDARANQLAHRLRRAGVGPEVLVALVIERSLELSVALLGILKAGGAYLPIDPAWPAERIAYMLEDACVPVLLTLGRLRPSLPETTAEILELDDPSLLAGEPETAVVPAATDPSALAYVIYTSGSTGKPKGTLNTHRGVVNRLVWVAPALDLSPADRVLQKTPVSFDVSVWELFVPLILGARLVYAAPGRHGDPDYLVETIRRHGITVVHFVPSMLQAFVAAEGLEACTSLRRVVASGEALPPDLVARWYARLEVPLWNLYGPTEAAVDVSFHQTSAHTAPGRPLPATIPIGRPLPNTHLVVLDAALRPVPLGVVGELALGGVQIGRGYRNRPALTAAVFIPDPFSAEPGARQYRTGDLARALPNGEIEYLGRIDHQVKVRGFRVELGEIEVALASHPTVQAAVVLAQPGPDGDVALVGYVTLGGLTTLTPGPSPAGGRGGPEGEGEAALRAHLATRLPDYMVPTWFVALAAFPLNPSGKVDRRALAALAVERGSAGQFVAPRTAAERLVAATFAEVLEVAEVSAHDDFFRLGGHSLKAIRLLSRLRAAGQVDLPLRAVFDAPTVAGLAARLGLAPGARERPFPRLAGDGPFALSFAQLRLWFLDRLEPGGAQYNIPTGLRLRGPFDPGALAAALASLVERHETLRARFAEGPEGPEVWIAPVPADLLQVVDLTDLPAAERPAAAERRATTEAARPFDLTSGRLLRALLLVLGPDDHGLVVTQHHIASDGWSLGIALGELAASYRRQVAGGAAELPPLPVRYVEFARWQRDELAAQLDERLAYWREALAGAPPLLALPTDRPRPVQASGRGGRIPIHLPAATYAGARQLAAAGGATLFMVLLAAWQALCARHAGADDVVVGSPVAGRLRPEVESLVGFFVNTLALRARLGDELAFADLVSQGRGTVLAAFAHQDLPFERLVEELAPDRGAGHPPLFQVAFALQNAPEAPRFAGIEAEALDFATTTAKFDLLLTLRETARGLVGGLEFDSDLFDAATAERFAARFEVLLGAAVARPGVRWKQLPWFSAAEREQVLRDGSDPAVAIPAAPIHQLFADQARRRPAAVALISAAGRLTYTELDQRADNLAAELRERGVRRDVAVALALDRSFDLIVASLAVLKAGGHFVPLDANYPADRLRFLLGDSKAKVVLAHEALLAKLPAERPPTIVLNGEVGSGAPRAARTSDSVPGDLAYVMYTSGSTGRPKGVAVPHEAVVRLVWGANFLPIHEDDVFLQLAPTSFDAATLEIWGPLLNGATLAIPPAGNLSLAEISAALARFRVSTLWLTAGLFHQMAEHEGAALARVRRVLAGGDVLAPAAVERVVASLAPGGVLVNGYGPTENTTFTACHVMTSAADLARPVPIGRPISNTAVRVLDGELQPVPVGVFGELHAGGLGVARGYLGRPGLTAERFVPDPWADPPGRRMYRTGDAARWRPDGTLEFAGRLDGQVKIRGFRVELGEIEAALASHPGVRAAVALVHQGPGGEGWLVGYVTHSLTPNPSPASGRGEQGLAFDEAALRAHLATRLPEVMVPTRFVILAELPLDPNGKVDRKALAALDPGVSPRSEPADEPPRSALEATVAAHFAAVLGLERVGVHERFFDLGGHSLKATQLVSRLRGELGVELPLRVLFEGPTVAELAAAIAGLAPGVEGALPALEPRTSAEAPPASYSQERVWVLERFEPGTATHNMPFAARLLGRPDYGLLAAALSGVVARHEALRTTFEVVAGRPVQIVAPAGPVPLPVVDLRHLPADQGAAAAEAVLAESARTGFDLAVGPLLRALVVLEGADRARFQLVLHHTVCDGWSIPILLDELGEIYRARVAGREPELPELPVQYGDFAVWQRRSLAGPLRERQLAYWRERLAGAPAGLALPLDRPRPALRGYRGGHTTLALPAELSAALRDLAAGADASLFMVLLAGFKALLARLAGESDVVVGAPIAGRGRGEVEGLIGMFLNTLVLRTDVAGEPSFRALVARVRETALGAFAHQDVPFEMLLDELKPERVLSHTPFFQIFFNVLNLPENRPLELPGVHLEPIGPPAMPSKFDLTLYVQPAEAVRIQAVFNADLFDTASIDRLLAQYQLLLATVVAAPERSIDACSLLLPADRQRLPNPTEALDNTWYGPVHGALERWAQATPERVALVGPEESFDYGEYGRRVFRLAHRLIELGVRRGDRVAILAQRTVRLPLAVLATLEAGGVFVMLDPSYPAGRLVDMLEIAAPRALLVLAGGGLVVPREVAQFLATQPGFSGTLVLPDLAAERAGTLPDPGAGRPETAPGVAVGPDDLAYIAFTSGSTGKPKGVMGRHGPLSHFLPWQVERFGLTSADRFTMLSGLAHDPLQRDLFTPLWLGAALVAPDPRDLGTPGRLAAWLARESLTVTHLTPAMGQILTERPSSGELIRAPTLGRAFLVGDVLTRRDVARLRQLAPNVTVINLYGSTETQRAVGFHEIPPAVAEPGATEDADPGREVLPLGRGMKDVQLLILNTQGGLTGIGEVGELVVRSPHLGAGYLGDAALTAAKFLANPATSDPTDRLYRTGDLGRYLPNGEAVFVGRADSQVKIRGFRIELGEIIGHLAQAPGVREVVVLLRRDGALGERLAAYVVAEPSAEVRPTAAALREFLKSRVPAYMVPATFVFLDGRLPVTPNNKLDRRALLALDDRHLEGSMSKEAPTTEVEQQIAAIVQEVLNVPSVGLDDNFFDLGGNSLLLIQVHGRLEQAFSQSIVMVELFNHPTVRSLAAFLAENAGGPSTADPATIVHRTEQLQEGKDRLKRRFDRRRS